jgi:hypothetical protein
MALQSIEQHFVRFLNDFLIKRISRKITKENIKPLEHMVIVRINAMRSIGFANS